LKRVSEIINRQENNITFITAKASPFSDVFRSDVPRSANYYNATIRPSILTRLILLWHFTLTAYSRAKTYNICGDSDVVLCTIIVI